MLNILFLRRCCKKNFEDLIKTSNSLIFCEILFSKIRSNQRVFVASFIEITLRHGCSPVNLLHILRTSLNGCCCTLWACCQFFTILHGNSSESCHLFQNQQTNLKSENEYLKEKNKLRTLCQI